MRNLIINRLLFRIHTVDDSEYGADILFKKGLNIIYGPNSVGKTSIVTGIVYGLGGEKGLGIFKNQQNPFKPEFYKSIDGKSIKFSYLILEISNGERDISIFRYITGKDTNIAAVKDCSIADFFKTESSLKLIINGEGVFSENGFQKYLFDFLELEQVEVPTYDQKFSKIYFENILPLFFVEQRAGWSQIQARQVTRYNIKDVKKVAFEYLMGLDKFEIHLAELKKKEIEAQLKKHQDELERKEENLLIISNAEKVDGVPIVNTENVGKKSIYDYINYLRNRYNFESDLINKISSQNKDFEDSNSQIRNNLRRYDFLARKLNEQIDKIDIEIKGYQTYLERINKNKYKNKQLRKIQEISTDLNIKSCPVCESTLKNLDIEGECILCHSDLAKKLSTPEQNLLFLEDEENTFKKVIRQRILDRRKLIERRDGIQEKIKSSLTQLDHQTKTFAGKEFASLRERILQVDSIHKDMEKYERIASRWNELNPLRNLISKLEANYKKIKEEMSKYIQTTNDVIILNTLKDNIQQNVRELGLFKGNPKLIDDIKIDENDNYTPYLDNYDIYNISSSSDNIRIILSYYLSMIQTSLKLSENRKIKFPNILILDEPKQQNLDNESLLSSINVIEKLPFTNSQVILTTFSDVKKDRGLFQRYIIHEMRDSTDYLLKKTK